MRGLPPQLAVIAGTLLLAAAGTAADERAIGVVERLHSALVAVAATEPPLTLAERSDALAPVIKETHDLETMARLTVRRFWRDWDASRRTAFVDTFERLSVATYASRFVSASEDTFAILGGETTADDRSEVYALIHRPDADDVPLDYLLQHDGETYRIINVLADGVSELSLMSAEYFDILESGGFASLIAHLDSQIGELE